MTLGDDSSEDCDESNAGTGENSTERSYVGEVKDKRPPGATGTASKNTSKREDVLLSHIGTMTTHIGSIATAMTSAPQNNGITREDVTTILKGEVKQSLRPTNVMLEKMHTLIERLASSSKT